MGQQDNEVAAAKVALGVQYTQTFEVQSKKLPELKGRITVALPTQLDRMRIGVLQHALREGVPLEQLDMSTAGLAVMLSTLAVVVRDAPDWWYEIEKDTAGKVIKREPNPGAILDEELLWDIYGRYVAFRDTFPGPVGGQGPGGAPA